MSDTCFLSRWVVAFSWTFPLPLSRANGQQCRNKCVCLPVCDVDYFRPSATVHGISQLQHFCDVFFFWMKKISSTLFPIKQLVRVQGLSRTSKSFSKRGGGRNCIPPNHYHSNSDKSIKASSFSAFFLRENTHPNRENTKKNPFYDDGKHKKGFSISRVWNIR